MTTDYPYKPNPGQTHFEGCWKTQGHHNCAVAEVRRLQELKTEAWIEDIEKARGQRDEARVENVKLKALLRRATDAIQPTCNWSDKDRHALLDEIVNVLTPLPFEKLEELEAEVRKEDEDQD